MTLAPTFPVSCAVLFDRWRHPSPDSQEAHPPGPHSTLGEGFDQRCEPGQSAPLALEGVTCGFWPASTAASEWWVPPQLSLPGVHPIGADELGELREVFPELADRFDEGRDVHPPAYESSGSSLVDGPTVHETDQRLNTGRNFGRHVRSLRRARGMTQEVLAERSGLSADTIRRLEHGSFSPSLDTLRKLCVGLNLMLSTLFESYELGARNEARELIDLLATRTPRELALATRVLRSLFDELDDMQGTGISPLDDDEDDDEEPDDEPLPPPAIDEPEDD
jgi:transcriptional regulator with XRE-family HTH domain